MAKRNAELPIFREPIPDEITAQGVDRGEFFNVSLPKVRGPRPTLQSRRTIIVVGFNETTGQRIYIPGKNVPTPLSDIQAADFDRPEFREGEDFTPLNGSTLSNVRKRGTSITGYSTTNGGDPTHKLYEPGSRSKPQRNKLK